jgi:hypothetical protein
VTDQRLKAYEVAVEANGISPVLEHLGLLQQLQLTGKQLGYFQQTNRLVEGFCPAPDSRIRKRVGREPPAMRCIGGSVSSFPKAHKLASASPRWGRFYLGWWLGRDW